MTGWWQLFTKAFTPDECQWLIDYGINHPVSEGKIGHGGTTVTNLQMRRSKVRWLRRDDPELFAFFARIQRMAEMANNNAFDLDLRYFNEIQFTEYDASDEGHYDWHEDNCWKMPKGKDDRKMSMVLLLSDPATYSGGRLELASDPLPDNKFVNQGDVIFFPAFNRHRVSPMTEGKRFSLVTWWKGPQLR